ncbi:MAG: TonB-dependent receptor [Pseudomonadota bacterium]
MKYNHGFGALILLSLLNSAPAMTQDLQVNRDQRFIEEVVVIGSKENAAQVTGSGTLLDATDLEAFDHIDLSQVLLSAPGVYVREEDGYGLRPNIGIRGAAADRSQKITLMEDGVLITPAPYSAPAAYYVPNVARIDLIEVLKGPSAIEHGPHTVGGAINFVTRQVPDDDFAEIDLSAGTDGYYKAQFAYGKSGETVSYLLDGLFYGTDGFKDLDGGGDTGFKRNDVNVKLRWQPQTERAQSLTLKLGFSDEDADETYLGLTDEDFDRDPDRRYRASQLARFESEHLKIQANYSLAIDDNWRFNAKAYHHEFDRQWNKLDGFIFGPALLAVFERPQQFLTEYSLLTGTANSLPIGAQTLDVTNNDRSFESQGLQFTVNHTVEMSNVAFDTAMGLRLHHDEVDRDHMPRGYLMTDGQLVFDGIVRSPKLLNHGETDALAIYLAQTISWQTISINLGIRYEDLQGELDDLSNGLSSDADQNFVSPGLGVYWQISERLGVLAGIYRGFSPAGPGSGADPEESLNYEYGFRYAREDLSVELIGFFSDYENLLGRCRVSDASCNPGEEFNGGEVEVSGAELSAGYSVRLSDSLNLSTRLTYTFTTSSFETGFLSQFVQWGVVEEGDELPYLPEHLGRLQLTLDSGRWTLGASIRFQSQMREEPGDGDIEDGLHTDDLLVVDLEASWLFSTQTMLQLIVQNVDDDASIVAHRPFGARPNRGRAVIARLRHRF